jgi:hypothetical protein
MTDDGRSYDYRPINALAYWDAIGTFVTDAVTETASASGRPERSLYPAAVAFVLWCWQSRGTPLERHRIFRRATVEEFIHLAMTKFTRGSRATHRSTLWLMVETLNPAEMTRSHRPIPRSAPTKPYTPQEVAALHSWATSQGTERRRRDAIALLALGLGAGLATREILGVRLADLDVHTDGMRVIVWEGRPRLVPILRAGNNRCGESSRSSNQTTGCFAPAAPAPPPARSPTSSCAPAQNLTCAPAACAPPGSLNISPSAPRRRNSCEFPG